VVDSKSGLVFCGGWLINEATILLIDTDKALVADIASALEAAGLQVTCATSGHQGLRQVYKALHDLLIVAENVPGINVEELCSRVWKTSCLPIIVLGTNCEWSHEARMLNAGADAYMCKPLDHRELVARVRSLLWRTMGLRPPSAGGSPEGDLQRQAAKHENGSVKLTTTEFRLLPCLALNDGRVVTSPELVAEVWADREVSRDCLQFYIRRLRQKLGGVLGGSGYIVNHGGIGYRFPKTI
jgi:two-component system KDP operon response regulator KdpE